MLEVGDLRLDPASQQVWRGEEEISLSRKEFVLLETFMRHPGEVLSRFQLLERAWDYYKAIYSREGIDGNYGPGYALSKSGDGSKLISGLVHWVDPADAAAGTGTSNAKWIDPYMIFGDGDGSTFSPLVTLDIVAHEWTHGVTSREAGLDGLNETPALNEHISDVFGAAAEAWRRAWQAVLVPLPVSVAGPVHGPRGADGCDRTRLLLRVVVIG